MFRTLNCLFLNSNGFILNEKLNLIHQFGENPSCHLNWRGLMTIEERLESLEKSNRKLKSVVALFLLITCTFATIAAKDNKLKNGNFETIKAKNIEVEGVVRSMGFLVHDKKGVKKVTIDPHGILIDATEGKIELRNGLIELRNA